MSSEKIKNNPDLGIREILDDPVLIPLMENFFDIIALVDPQGIIKFMSNSVTRITGFTPGELVGKHFIEIIHPDDVSYLINLLTLIPENRYQKESAIIKYRGRTKSGEWIYFQSVAKSLLNPSCPGAIILSKNLEEQMKVERKYEEERLKRLSELEKICLSTIISLVNKNGDIPGNRLVGQEMEQSENSIATYKERIKEKLDLSSMTGLYSYIDYIIESKIEVK